MNEQKRATSGRVRGEERRRGWHSSLGSARGGATALLLLATLAGCAETPVPDLVVVGELITLDDAAGDVAALAASEGRIVFLGSEEEARALAGDETRIVELGDATGIPGLIEGHGHFMGVGEAQLQLPLQEAASWQEIVEWVRAAADEAPSGQWIRGRGWHQAKWDQSPGETVEGLPIHAELSAVSPDHPVYLTHASGHMAFVNAKALELAGITSETADPAGGEIVRGADGAATGALRETAQGLVGGVLAEALAAEKADWNAQRRVAQLAAQECVSKGITSFQDAGSTVADAELLSKMGRDGALPLRVWMMMRTDNDTLAGSLERLGSLSSSFFTVGGIKKSIDGALGAHGAWLLEPYSDLPTTSGLNTTSLEEIAGAADLALEHDLQLCVHAIGDRANRETLDLFEEKLAGDTSKRWRVEHAQHLSEEDIPRFAELGVVASMQGVHCTSDGPWVPERLGEERSRIGAYVWRKLIDSGAVVSNGTDAPVEDVDPLASYVASVTRRMGNGEQFYPDQVMTREEALRSYTIQAAYAAFEEDDKGSLELGKFADVTVLSVNPLTASEDELRAAEVVMTIVGGEVVYERE